MEFRLFKTITLLLKEAELLLKKHLQLPCTVPHAIMLSGGKTPLPVYESIAEQPFTASANLYVIMSDERMVPADSPDNNMGNASGMLSAIHIPESRILAVKTTLPPDEAAMRFNSAISDFLAQGGRLTLALLGIGTDGHTASLFSMADIEASTGSYAIHVSRGVPPDRVSTTPAVIKKAERIVFLAVGKEKEEIVRRLRTDPDSVIAGQVVKNVSNVEIWCA